MLMKQQRMRLKKTVQQQFTRLLYFDKLASYSLRYSASPRLPPIAATTVLKPLVILLPRNPGVRSKNMACT
jgi:hypothetical protein